MSDRFEVSLESNLAEIFEGELQRVLKSARFRETLRLAEPSVAEFQRGSDLLSVHKQSAGSHRWSVAVESETVDVEPLVVMVVRGVILAVSRQLLQAITWTDTSTALARIEACLPETPVGSS